MFFDVRTGEKVLLPYNPNTMDSPTTPREMTFAWNAGGRISSLDRGALSPTQWSFGGVILEKYQYGLLLSWAERNHVLRVTDHLGRTFEIIIEKFDPIERLPTPRRQWRADYTMTCLLLKELM